MWYGLTELPELNTAYSGKDASAVLLTTNGNKTTVVASLSRTQWCECTPYPQTYLRVYWRHAIRWGMRMSEELCDPRVRIKHGHPDIARKDTKNNFLIMSAWTVTKMSHSIVFFRLPYQKFYLQLGLSQLLTEMSIRNIFCGIKRPVRKADSLITFIC